MFTHRPFVLLVLRIAVGLALATGSLAAAEPIAKLNVILIMADDFGYECVGANGGTSYQTPVLDGLAAGGMRFRYAFAQPLCTPTRVQLMTGQYNVRNYTKFGHLDPTQTTFAHLFRQAGYLTGIAGKWQLGGEYDQPGKFGFDAYCLWQLNRRPERYKNPGLEIDGRQIDYSGGEYGPDLVNAYARDFIEKHRDRPFFLYYPMMLTHDPFVPTPDSADWNARQPAQAGQPAAGGAKAAGGQKAGKAAAGQRHFAEMTAYMDKLIGKLVAKLDELKLRERTLILFLGDNGTHPSIRSQMGDIAVQGGKGSGNDAGMHVPFIASLPGVIPAGRVSDDLIDTSDFLPTLAAAAGLALPKEVPLDGRSFWPQLCGEKGEPRAWTYCWYARNGGAKAAVEFARTQRFKLYRDGKFYDLERDPQERSPLAVNGLTGDIAAIRTQLQVALDQYADARPK